MFTFERPLNHRKMCLVSSLQFFDIKQLHDPSFVSKRWCNFKRFQSDYLFIYLFFQNYPLSQYYRDHQFWGVSKTRGRGRGRGLGRGISFF